jgi:uncharacterized cupin superfamily protein
VPNIEDANYELRSGPPGFNSKRARIGYELGTEAVGVSLWELPPGVAAYPYHFHYSDEEVVIVLDGRPTLRTPEGERLLERGEAVRFPVGEEGAHQIWNGGEETVRFLAVSNNGHRDIAVYPDSGKAAAVHRGTDDSGVRYFFPLDAVVDYWEGETAPEMGREPEAD